MRVCDKCGAEAYAHLHIDRDDIHLDVCSAHYAAFFEWLSATERQDMQVQNSPPAEQAGSNGTPGTRRKRGRPPINRQVEP